METKIPEVIAREILETYEGSNNHILDLKKKMSENDGLNLMFIFQSIPYTLTKLTNKITFIYYIICDTGSTDNTVEIVKNFFNEFTIQLPIDANVVNKKLLDLNIIGGFVASNNKMILAVSELTSDNDMKILAQSLAKIIA